MAKENTSVELVYSKIEDKDFAKNINDSPVWKECYHKDELPEGFKGFEYKVKFDGLKPIQLMSVKKA